MEHQGHESSPDPVQDRFGCKRISAFQPRREAGDAEVRGKEDRQTQARRGAVGEDDRHGRFQAGRKVRFAPYHKGIQDPHRLRTRSVVRCHTLFRDPGGTASVGYRRGRHHARPPGPLRNTSSIVQVRLQGARVLHTAHQGSHGPAPAGQHQTGIRRGQEDPVRRIPCEAGDPAHDPSQVQRDHRHRSRCQAHIPQRRAHPRIRHSALPHR